jgi:uncharacterized membrane protein
MLESILVVLVVASLPFSELRGAIPLAIGVYRFDPVTAYLLGVLGNLLPVPLLLWLLEPLTNLLRRLSALERLIIWLFARTRKRHSALVERFGALALVLFVAIPLPLTGAWTGVLITHLFGIPLRYALPLITLGVAIAGLLVTLATLGFLQLRL